MFLARATATALGRGPCISPDRTFDGLEKGGCLVALSAVLTLSVLTGRSAVLARWLTADLILTVLLIVTADR